MEETAPEAKRPEVAPPKVAPPEVALPNKRAVPMPEASVAGDWTVLAGIAAAVAALLFWRRRLRERDH
jgi:hypothetical protein